MALKPDSPILEALYHGRRDDAARLADTAAELTVFEAAALGRDDRLRTILQRSPDLANGWAADGHTPLGLAAFFGSATTVALLLEHGAAVSTTARNDMRVQPLHAAVAAKQLESVRLLLGRGADPNARQQLGYTPLMGAAAGGREDLVDLLVQHGADAGLVNEQGTTAAEIAREHGHDALAERLAGSA